MTRQEFQHTLAWLIQEREYQESKFDYEKNDTTHTKTFGEDYEATKPRTIPGTWPWQLQQYLDRAYLLGLENPNGRQALAKFAATAVAMVESVVRVYGPLPEPGVPSGELREWNAGNRSRP